MWADWPSEWVSGFGRSPECRSYAKGADAGTFTFSNCATSHIIATGVYPPEIPPLFQNMWNLRDQGQCCGNCSVGIEEVRMYYFAEKDPSACATDQNSNATLSSPDKLKARAHSLIANDGIAVVSGHTLYDKGTRLH